MTDLDTVARRHAELTRLAANRGNRPGADAVTDSQPPQPRQFSWLPAAAAAMLVLVVGVAGSLFLAGRGDRITSPAVTNGLIVWPGDWSPLAITPDGKRVDFDLPAKVRLGEEGSMTWAPDGRRMAVITHEGALVIVDTVSGTADPVEVALKCRCRLD